MKKLYTFIYTIAFLVIVISCNKHSSDYTNDNADVLREWKFQLSSSNENHVNGGPVTVADFHMQVLSDGSMRYDISVDSNLDKILGAEIDLGDPVSDGALLTPLTARISNSYVSGIMTGVRQSLIDTLLDDTIQKYVNVISQTAPSGLVRGQLNSTIVLSNNVNLTGSQEIPAVTTASNGTAYIRITSDQNLYSKVVINSNDVADPVTAATINIGASGATGPVIVSIVSSLSDFNTSKKYALKTADYSTLLNSSLYVNVSSTLNNGGKLRGQLK